MSWKKSQLFFVWQLFRFSKNLQQLKRNWSFRDRWLSSFKNDRNSVSDELPWLNFKAIDFLRGNQIDKSKVFEFGGGGSTLFFCKYAAQVATVEDNEGWFGILSREITGRNYANWQGYFISPEPYSGARIDRSPSNPNDFMSGSPGLSALSFEKYARCIEQFPPQSFDIVLVDGRARPSCIQTAIPHLKSGGMLIVDNTERAYYLQAFQQVLKEQFEVLLDEFAPVGYTPDFTKTSIFRKL